MKALGILILVSLLVCGVTSSLAATITFEGLQLAQIDRYAAMVAGIGPYGARSVTPDEIARHSFYLDYSGYPGRHGDKVFSVRLPWTARTRVPVVAAFIGAATCALAVLWFVSAWPRVLPYAASPGERLRASCKAVMASWLWAAGIAALIAASVWYVGFDRSGASGPPAQWLTPGGIQLVVLAVLWCAACVAIGAVLLPSRFRLVVGPSCRDRELCRRCGYPVAGRMGSVCPECGLSASVHFEEIRCRVRRTATRTGAACAVVSIAIIAAAVVSDEVRDWLLLRPRAEQTAVANGWLADGEPPQVWRSWFGDVTVSARLDRFQHHGRGMWVVEWSFAPVLGFKADVTSGTIEVPVTLGDDGRPRFEWHELPCGPVALYSKPGDSRLHVRGPWVNYYELGDSTRPFAAP